MLPPVVEEHSGSWPGSTHACFMATTALIQATWVHLLNSVSFWPRSKAHEPAGSVPLKTACSHRSRHLPIAFTVLAKVFPAASWHLASPAVRPSALPESSHQKYVKRLSRMGVSSVTWDVASAAQSPPL